MDTVEYLSLVDGGVDTFGVEWQSDVRPAAAHRARVLRKVTTATVMTGAEYDKMRVNKDRETGPLPWGSWAHYPHVIEHRGVDYFRMYTVDNSVRTIYTVDGEVVRREEFLSYLTPSQRGAARPHAGCVTVKASGVRLVGEPGH